MRTTLLKTVGFALTAILLLGAVVGAVLPLELPADIPFDDWEKKREVYDANPVSESFLNGVADFSYDTAAEVFKDAGTNQAYSPLSLYFALSLAASGANGTTQAELLELLRASDASGLAKQNGNLFRYTYFANEIGRLKIANSLWLAESFDGQPVHFRPDFLKTAREQFYAEARQIDFAAATAGATISEWIAAQTDGKLKPEITIDPAQILSLINTVDFYDEWTDRFDERLTQPAAFHLADGTDVTVDFMHRVFGSAGFARGKNFTRAGLQLKNNGRMVFVLPDEGVTPAELLSDSAGIRETLRGGEDKFGEVKWTIPIFDVASEADLSGVLQRLGATTMFSAAADFSALADHPAFVSEVRQQARVAVDEKGVSAAAFTEIVYCGAAPPVDSVHMRLDRPFIYGIYSPSGTLLFIGVVDNPAAAH